MKIRLLHGKTLFILAGILFNFVSVVHAQESQKSAPYYPSANNRVPVGGEDILNNYSSLAGLQGVYVELDYVLAGNEKLGVVVGEDLRERVRHKFEIAGLRMLTKEQMKITPGLPELAIYPSYSGEALGAGSCALNTTNDEPSIDGHCGCCRNGLWVGFSQSASILRWPDAQFKLGTWGKGADTQSCHNRGLWIYENVLALVDDFLTDYKKAESEKQPIKGSKEPLIAAANGPTIPAQAGGTDCRQALALFTSVFDANAITPNAVFRPILNTFAKQAKNCGEYDYMIETHTDKRAGSRYNQLLSEARALAIKQYLLEAGIENWRLKTYAHGESQPLTDGTTEADHALNRRVVITPVIRAVQ